MSTIELIQSVGSGLTNWFGPNAIPTVLLIIATLSCAAMVTVGLILNHRRAAEALWLSAKSSLVLRYQTGVDLIARKDEIARLGGVALLRDVARLAPDDYGSSVASILTQLVETDAKRQIANYLEAVAEPSTPDQPVRPRATPSFVIAALSALTERAVAWNLRIRLSDIAIIGGRFRELDFSHLEFGPNCFFPMLILKTVLSCLSR